MVFCVRRVVLQLASAPRLAYVISSTYSVYPQLPHIWTRFGLLIPYGDSGQPFTLISLTDVGSGGGSTSSKPTSVGLERYRRCYRRRFSSTRLVTGELGKHGVGMMLEGMDRSESSSSAEDLDVGSQLLKQHVRDQEHYF